MILPFAILAFLVWLLPPWDHAEASKQSGAYEPSVVA